MKITIMKKNIMHILVFASMFSGIIEQSQPAVAQENIMNIRTLLKKDFNIDLNISGGDGKKDAPIIIQDKDRSAAALTEIQVLRGLGRGRGILWRTQGKNLFESNGKKIEQFKIETKEVSETKIVTQLENYYFDISASEKNKISLPDAEVNLPNNLGSVPFDFSWLHYSSLENNEIEYPGYGVTIAYGSPGIKGTIYIYDNKLDHIPSDINNIEVIKEFEKSKIDILKVHADTQSLADEYISTVIRVEKMIVNGEKSILGLGVYKGKFFKVRISNIDDPVLNEAVLQCVKAIELFLSNNKKSL
jgi:hypothetical protein